VGDGKCEWGAIENHKKKIDPGKTKRSIQAEIEARTLSNRLSMELIDEKKFGENLPRKFWRIYLFLVFGFIGVLGWKLE
jgi:hypothetical protein